MLIQSDSRLYIRRGQGSGSPGEEGTGKGRKRESRGREWIYMRVGSGSRNKESNSLNSLLRPTEQKNEPENEQEC